MLDWLQRYCTNDEGLGHDTPHMFEWGAWVAEIWALATDRKTLVAIRNSRRWSVGSGFNRLGIGRLGAAVRAESPDWAIECDLADLLRFAGYVQRDACASCCQGSKEMLYHWTITRPPYMQIGLCVDCWQSNGWITPAMPADDRKALVGGVMVCDLLAEAVAALGVTSSDVYVLNSAVHKLLSPKRPGRGRVKSGDPEYARLEAFFGSVQVIEEARLFLGHSTLDATEIYAEEDLTRLEKIIRAYG